MGYNRGDVTKYSLRGPNENRDLFQERHFTLLFRRGINPKQILLTCNNN